MLLKTQIFEKKANFSLKKIFVVVFSRFIECDKAHETLYKGPQVLFTIAF